MIPGLNELDEQFHNSKEPDFISSVLYLFWDKGIDCERFSQLPLPYIFSILSSHKYKIDEEEKQMKKARKGKI